MLKSPSHFTVFVLGIFLLLASGCDRNDAETKKLFEENQRLRGELEQAKRGAAETKVPSEPGTVVRAPDIDVAINDLWIQRFEDNEFRSKQRLADKIVRVTGVVDSVTDNAITIRGASKRFGHIRMTVNLNAAYAGRIGAGLGALEQGIPVTVQGKFAYERTSLGEAAFVDPKSGKTLSSEELAALVQNSGAGAPPSEAAK